MNAAFCYFKGLDSSMKKLAMLTVKGAVGLVPKTVRNKLKTNHHLTELYSRSLQRSGLFYGFPSEKKRMALYSAYLKQQEAKLASLEFPNLPTNDIYIVVLGYKNFASSLKSIFQAGVNQTHIYAVAADNVAENITSFSTLSKAVEQLPSQAKAFFINSGDVITSEALKASWLKINAADIVYCDTDKVNGKKQRVSPYFLPDWNPELQLSTAYVSTGVLVTAQILKRSAIAANTIAGMITELWLKNTSIAIDHVAYTLVHRSLNKAVWRDGLEDVARVVKALTQAVPAFNEQQGVIHNQWPVASQPLVSLIIPTKNGKELVKACITSILEKTVYQNYEILLIDNGSDEPASLQYFEELGKHPKIRVLRYPGVFNYSAINNFGVQHASANSEIIGLINNDIEVIQPEWLTSMVGHALREDVGCVGAKLLYSDGRVQHAGVVLGYGGGAGHAHKYFPRYHPGYMKRLIATQNYSAITAACLLVKKSLFEAVGGLNETDLTVAFNDVDFCLRVKETGVRNVYCAEAELYHHESVSRGLDHAPEKAARFNKELAYLKTKWSNYIEHDPAYSPNLTLKRENFSVKTKEEF